MVVLCLLAALDNTFIVLKGSMTKTARVVFCSTLLDTISNFLRAHVKITGIGLAAGCQLFYQKTYGNFLHSILGKPMHGPWNCHSRLALAQLVQSSDTGSACMGALTCCTH